MEGAFVTKYLRWYLLLIFVASSGCSVPGTNSSPRSILDLRVELPLDETSTSVKCGSGFALSPKIIITAMHVVAEGFGTIYVQGYPVVVESVQGFGEDGVILVVEALPPGVGILAYNDYYQRGGDVQSAGYPAGEPLTYSTGVLTAPKYCSAEFRQGTSGGPVMHNGVVFGVVSAYMPELGVSRYEPLNTVLLKALIHGNG